MLNPALIQIIELARRLFPNAGGLLVGDGFFINRQRLKSTPTLVRS